MCEALIAENIDITIIGSTRADDIVRDADLLHLYRKAGIERFLLGIENTDEATLQKIRKGRRDQIDREAIRVMRKHGILSLATWVADFEDVTDRDFFRALRQLISYDPDQITALFVTPHRWTGYFRLAQSRQVIQTRSTPLGLQAPGARLLAHATVASAAVGEVDRNASAGAPRAVWRTFFHPDRALRQGMRWYTRMGRRVWFHELKNFLVRDCRTNSGPTLAGFWGFPQDHQEIPLRIAHHREKDEQNGHAIIHLRQIA